MMYSIIHVYMDQNNQCAYITVEFCMEILYIWEVSAYQWQKFCMVCSVRMFIPDKKKTHWCTSLARNLEEKLSSLFCRARLCNLTHNCEPIHQKYAFYWLFGFYVWFMIYFNCDVIKLIRRYPAKPAPILHPCVRKVLGNTLNRRRYKALCERSC